MGRSLLDVNQQKHGFVEDDLIYFTNVFVHLSKGDYFDVFFLLSLKSKVCFFQS